MWIRTPPKPVDALITFIMAAALQFFVLAVWMHANAWAGRDPSLQGHHLFGHGVFLGFGFLASLVFFAAGSVKFLAVKEEEKRAFRKVMLWNRVLMRAGCLFFILAFLRRLTVI